MDTTRQEMLPVPIWRCTNQECKAWVRDELASSGSPECPMCKAGMIRGIKHLPQLIKKHKAQPRKKNADTPWLQ